MSEEINKITEKAIDDGFKNADTEWKTMALECVRVICTTHETFTMNDVRSMVRLSPIKTQDNRAMGGIVKTARALGWISPTGNAIVSKVGHKSALQVWKSNICKKS